jgi:exopolyphosphatase / guanosine-5'-triphosphate,3'-diphosphate pyrophosphatase
MDWTTTLAAIDVGTNSVRLKLARPRPDGSLAVVCEQRDSVRPGEGVFGTGNMAPAAVDRLLAVLARYVTICRAHGAEVGAVATSALREAHNRDVVLARARGEVGLDLEILSGRDEARLICLGVLRDEAPEARSLVIDVGGGSTEVISARGERPVALWSVDLGSVRLTEHVRKHRGGDDLRALRRLARDIVATALPRDLAGPPDTALGSSGTIRAVVAYAAPAGTNRVTHRQLVAAVGAIAAMTAAERCACFGAERADIVMAGAVALEAVIAHVGIGAIAAVTAGLADGVLAQMARRERAAARPAAGRSRRLRASPDTRRPATTRFARAAT